MTDHTAYHACPATSTSSLPLDRAHHILSTLPPTHFAFAYGSAIIPQTNVDSSRRMIDLILVVEDAHAFHKANLTRNPTHYTPLMSALGPAAITRLQHTPHTARVYYNTIMSPTTASTPSFKYGVVDLSHLRHDLYTWNSLYLSGRLHKPVSFLSHNTPPPSLLNALRANLESAAAAALLILPPAFTDTQLYTTLATLSYLGDVRQHLALEPHSKVPDIVQPNLHAFRNLYAPTTTLSTHATHNPATAIWNRDMHPDTTAALLRTLPPRLRHHVADTIGISLHHDPTTLHHVHGMYLPATLPPSHVARTQPPHIDTAIVSQAVTAAVAATVARSSFAQSAKGLITAGIGTSLRYVGAKFRKSMRVNFDAAVRQLRPR